MTKKCNNCGNEAVAKVMACDLTGVNHESHFGGCDCKDLDFLPESIQKKIRDLEELETLNIALGIHDKLSAARYMLNQEIEDFRRSRV